MKYITKEIFLTKETSKNANKYVKAFEKLFNQENYIKKQLGNDYSYQEINTFTHENIICPNNCPTNLYYTTTILYSNDEQKKLICVKCTNCNLQFIAYQEIIPN